MYMESIFYTVLILNYHSVKNMSYEKTKYFNYNEDLYDRRACIVVTYTITAINLGVPPQKYYLTGVTVVVVGGGPVLGVFFFVFFLDGRLEEFPVIQCNVHLTVNMCN